MLHMHLNQSVEQGASTTVWSALAPELEGVGGKYLEECQISISFLLKRF